MRLLSAVLGCLTIALALAGCSGEQSPPTAPVAGPVVTASAGKPASLDPTHTYAFELTCSTAARNSEVTILTSTNIPRITTLCNSSTELGAAYGTALAEFGYELTLDSPGGKTCSAAGVTTTGTFRCKVQRYSAALTVTDLGVVTP